MKNNKTAESKKTKDLSLIKVIFRLFPIVYKSCPRHFVLTFAVGFIYGILVINTFVTQKFFDAIEEAAKTGHTSLGLFMLAILVVVFILAAQVLNGIYNFMIENFFNRAAGHMASILQEKAGRISPIIYEEPKFLDDVNKAKSGIGICSFFIYTVTTLFTHYIPYFLVIGTYLFLLKPILAISIIFVFIPVYLSQIIRTSVFTKLEDKVAPLRRETEYYESCFCNKTYFKETRLLGSVRFFKGLYMDSKRLMLKERWKAEKKTGLLEFAMKLCTLAGYGGVLFLLINSLLAGDISIGAVMAVFGAIDSMFTIMEEILGRNIVIISSNFANVKNYLKFLDLPERTGSVMPFDKEKGITAKEVSFRYPQAENNIINNISLDIKPGEIIAVVGENGAGKSTLVKLLTGLYVPEEGLVTIGGLDTKEAAPEIIFNEISGVFQKYQQYKFTLEDNVIISSSGSKEGNLDESLEKADVDINSRSFPQGKDTMLSREFDGVDLSGGQWQRVAIARGFYRSHGIIVLDEPTAAIDPVEETKLYKKFAEISKGVTSIIVTHRLGSARIADRIVVMDEGRIVEIGGHEELVGAGGKYAQLFQSQAQWYQ